MAELRYLWCFELAGYRTNKVDRQMLSVCDQKFMTCFPVCKQNQKYNLKLYIMPDKIVAQCRVPRSSVGSLKPGEKGPQNGVSATSLYPDNYQSMNDFERQLQELFDDIKQMIRMGNKSDATDLLKANYEMVNERLSGGAKGIEEAAVLDIIALGFMAVGDLNFVDSLLKVMKEVVDTLKDDAPRLDSILMHMGSIYSTLGNFEKSLDTYQRAIYIMKRTYGKDSTFLVTPYLGMAKVYGSDGKAAKAMEMYQYAITLLELSRGAESKDLVVPLLGLGNLLLKEGRAVDAEAHFTRVLNIFTSLYGQNDGRSGIAMNSLAQVKCAQGKVDEAIHLYKSALQILKESNYMSLDNSIMEKMRVDLAELLHASGRGQEGRAVLEECLLITERYKGNEHPDLVTHMMNLATSYSQSKNYVEAERLLRRSLRIMTKMATDDQSITYPMLHLAVTLYHLKQDEEAEQFALEALRIREKAFGDDSLPVGEALDCLVSIQTRLGRDDSEILKLLKRMLTIQEREFGHESEGVMVTLKKIVYYLDKLGGRDEMLPIQRRLSVLRKKYKNQMACRGFVRRCYGVIEVRRRGMPESTVSSSSTSTRRRRATMARRLDGDVGERRVSTMCQCGLFARMYTSWTKQNPGRRFFGCRNYKHGRGCGFFKWHDDEMGERAKDVINELLEHVENLNDGNVGLRIIDEGGAAENIEQDIATIYAKMRKNERRLKQSFCALFITWCFCLFLLLR